MSGPTRPVLRYHGGKWKLAPWLISFFPPHRVYVEPFGGAASVLLRKPRSYAEVYNDLDGEVVDVFRVMRDPMTRLRLYELLTLTPFAREEFADAYIPTSDPVERARRAIVRTFMGFGSASFNAHHATGFRTYTKGNRDRLPVRDWAEYPRQLAAYGERLTQVIIEQRPAALVMAAHDGKDTLHYVDPPYPLTTRGCAAGVRTKYRHELTESDHRALAETLRGLAGMVVLSGYPCPLYDVELYADWERHERPHFADGARQRTEVVWLNPACSQALAGERRQHELPMVSA